MSRCRTKRQITLCPVEDPDKIVLWNYFLLYQIRQRVTARVIVVIIRILILCNFPIIISVCWIIIILTDNFNTPIWFRRKINIIGHSHRYTFSAFWFSLQKVIFSHYWSKAGLLSMKYSFWYRVRNYFVLGTFCTVTSFTNFRPIVEQPTSICTFVIVLS